jgi:sugar phosphate isomerase/epimerase
MATLCSPPKNNIWGLTVAWYPDYLNGHPATDFSAKIDFLKRSGMTAFTCSLDEVEEMSIAVRSAFFAAIDAKAMAVCPHFSCAPITAGPDERKAETGRIVSQIDEFAARLKAPLITCTTGDSSRYDRVMPFQEKVSRFAEVLEPIVEAAKEIGVAVAIENHADYYVSEIVEIIHAVPGLGLLFDTANALHIGEHPYKAAVDAAPYTIGTHFKDHIMVRGEAPPLHYEITGCALGDGDAMLGRCYREIVERSPHSDRLVMLIELFKGENQPALECWERSVGFINRLIEECD